jgi:hypothetical protein
LEHPFSKLYKLLCYIIHIYIKTKTIPKRYTKSVVDSFIHLLSNYVLNVRHYETSLCIGLVHREGDGNLEQVTTVYPESYGKHGRSNQASQEETLNI